MRKFLFAITLTLLLAGMAAGQGASIADSVLRPAATIPGASIRVCTEAASGTPCSPLATIYSDRALSAPIAGSIIVADARGNFQFYALPGWYQLQISAAGFATFTRTIAASGNVLLDGNNTFTGSNIFGGSSRFNGAFQGSAGNALTLPTTVDTLVGRATTDTLSNKTLPSPAITGTVTGGATYTSPTLNTPTLNGSGGLLTLPAGPDTLVGRATTDTLTNKTITNAIISVGAPSSAGALGYTAGNLKIGDGTIARTVPNNFAVGTAAMTTAGIATGACGTTVTVSATGVVTTDSIDFSRNAAATIGNGGGLTLNAWPTADNVNFNYCNSAAGTITPTAMTINWVVRR